MNEREACGPLRVSAGSETVPSRAKKINPDNSKTLYVGGIYEVDKNSGGTVTGTKTYYPAAGATLAPEREAFSFTPALAGGARECRCANW